MFTGIVQALGIIIATSQTEAGKRLTVSMAELGGTGGGAGGGAAGGAVKVGDSVCVAGVCLTVAKVANGNLTFDVVTETLRRTNLGRKQVADRLNLELPLRANDFVGGHFVQGHVDAVGKVVGVQAKAEDWRITIELAGDAGDTDGAMMAIVPKGSVAVDGVAMTIAETKLFEGGSGAGTFTLAVIPVTREKTTLSILRVGDLVNVETDILVRSVVHVLKGLRARGEGSGGAAAAGWVERGVT